jgi:tetratricopeptide (TPR) repeat protein
MSLRLRLLPLVSLLLLVWAGCSPTAETALDEQRNSNYQTGKDRLSAMDYKGAIEAFERATEDNPRSALAHFELGVLYDQHENDYAAALYHYNRALKLRPNAYPADNIRYRIPACRQELVKADSLTISNPSVLRETERLREQNEILRKQVEALQAHLAGRVPAVATSQSGQSGLRSVSSNSLVSGAGNGLGASANRTTVSDPRRAASSAGGARTHVVKAGDTPFSISRQYSVKLVSLMAANPGLDAKRMKIGQTLNIPNP